MRAVDEVSRINIKIVSFLMLLWAIPAVGQLQLDGLHLGAAGDLSAGYSGDLSNQTTSDHGITFGGDASIHGFYYAPGFISFDATPYYGRSQSNSSSESISNSSGYTSNVGIFSGTRFPGNISFNQGFDTTGVFGIPGSTGLATKDSNKSFAIGWSFLFPDLPSLSVGYSDGSGTSSIPGSSAQTTGSSRTFNIHTGYRIAGFTISGGFIHLNTTTNSTGLIDTSTSAGDFLSNNSSSSSYIVNAQHPIFLGGSLALALTRSTYTDNSGGSVNSGVTDNLNASAGINVRTFPITGSLSYSDNVYGAVEQEILSNGGSVLQTSLSPVSRSALFSLSTSHTVFNRVFVNAFLDRQEQDIGGQFFGLTQYGANAAYNFAKFFRGLIITIGVTDGASQVGNLGANLRTNVNYNRNFGPWEFSGNYAYDQNVQTLMAFYTASTMNYTAQVHRKFHHGISVNFGAGGGRSGFEQVAGNSNESLGFNTSVSWYRFSVGGTYSESNGAQVLTGTGVVSEPVPIANPDTMVNFDGKGYGLTVTAVPLRAMSISASYSKSLSNTSGAALSTMNESDLMNAFCTYRLRKFSFISGVTKFTQSMSGTGVPPSVITSYYFGISRWFKLF